MIEPGTYPAGTLPVEMNRHWEIEIEWLSERERVRTARESEREWQRLKHVHIHKYSRNAADTIAHGALAGIRSGTGPNTLTDTRNTRAAAHRKNTEGWKVARCKVAGGKFINILKFMKNSSGII